MPFSQAHEAAGACVKVCEGNGIELHQLTDSDLSSIHPQLTGDVRKYLNADGAIGSRTSSNGTSPTSVRQQISELNEQIKEDSNWIADERKRFSGMMAL